VTVRLPPLRERREDIPLLAAHFIKEFNHSHHKQVTTIAEPVRKAMASYDWPGNVRELRNTIESMVVQDQDGVLDMDDLQEGDTLRRMQSRDNNLTGPASLVGRPLTEVERYYMQQALERSKGNRVEAARMLGIGERTLYRVMQDWKLQDKIRQALSEANGNLEEAARHLGIKEQSLQRKIKKWGMTTNSESSP
jgi:two-component system response regulator HydG